MKTPKVSRPQLLIISRRLTGVEHYRCSTMATLKTLHLAHLPSDLAVHIALFQNLENAAFLRQQLLDGNADFEYALVDAGVV